MPFVVLVLCALCVHRRHGVKNSDFVINTNVYGPLHTTNAFLPLLEPEGGRVVMVSSGSAPMFVEKCSEAVQAKFIDEDVTLEQVAELLTAYRKAGEANAEGSDDPKLEAAVAKAFKVRADRPLRTPDVA